MRGLWRPGRGQRTDAVHCGAGEVPTVKSVCAKEEPDRQDIRQEFASSAGERTGDGH